MSGFSSTDRLAEVLLEDAAAPPRSPEMQQELDVALYDLREENHFRPIAEASGPFRLLITRTERGVVFEIADALGAPVASISMPPSALREAVEDYTAICERYFGAVRKLPPAEIEAIDSDRKAIHDDGAALIARRLEPAARLDHATARRLFTVICALTARPTGA
ncbi:MAG: UPF0262 family protein [Pseudomonadota bacterium]